MAKRRPRARFTQRAEADLDSIAVYTEARWGETQVEAYLLALRSMVEHLAAFPHLGLVVEGREEKRFPIHDHVIYYRQVRGGIEVTRVLHGSQHRLR